MASFVIGGKDEGLIKGFLEYESQEYSFSYENRILHIYPKERETWLNSNSQLLIMLGQKIDTGRFIGNIFLDGRTATGKNIRFVVSEQYSNVNGFLSFDVYAYYIFSAERTKKNDFEFTRGNDKVKIIPNKIKGIVIKGREIDYFYNPATIYHSEIQQTKGHIGFNISLKENIEKECGKVVINHNKAEISLRCIANFKARVPTPLTSRSAMVIRFEKEVDLNDIDNFYIAIVRCLSYLCRRTNIHLDEIEVFDIDDENSYKFGIYYYLQNNDTVETNEKASQRIIDYGFLREKFGDVLQIFLNNEIYIDNLPSNINSCNTLKADRIIFNFVAFEREYDNLYPQTEIRSAEYIEIKKHILSCIDRYINELRGQRKKYAKEFYRTIKNSGNSLGVRLKKALSDNEKALKPFLINNYGRDYSDKIEDICMRLNRVRNDTAHGNLGIVFEPCNVSDFIILECLIYSMRLKEIGMEDIRIQQAICKLMGFNIYIPEQPENKKE